MKSMQTEWAYLAEMSKHEDDAVKEAANVCLKAFATSFWYGRYKRKLLSNLSWALLNYIKGQS